MPSKKKTKTPKIKKVKQAEMVQVLRSEIVLADYNPRFINKDASNRLKKQIKEDSLVDTIIVNKQTMNVVGGNQRTAELDSIYKYKPGQTDYSIVVQMIDVDPRTEIKINARLNNPDAAGEYDAGKMLELATEFDMGLNDFNMDRATFDIFVNESGFDSPFDDIAKNIGEVRDISNAKGSLELEQDKLEQSSLQERKKAALEKQYEKNREGNSEYIEHDDYIVTVIFNTNTEKQEFMQKIGYPKKKKFIKIGKFRELVKQEFL